ncbi:Uncharacterized membrane protein YesL [Sanguibacter gelidistatuariae]|uniref:Uncharacterized membrane protein YesL n=1 Tax=Sanguibacter gelidistatuariae TaxID=1814289 RepID=A0A1G6WD36_9MICO|nr:DUF624 domain-containing protein [Sanguibacter gelidistatuariae]SDD63603.1 Uncharacterized membrane protein YesL [Sanguibacter gelidistatuariae]
MSVVTAPRRRWEHKLLTILSYPANLMFAGVAAAILSLGVVTALPAAIAASRAMSLWLRDGEDAVFTTTFKEFAATWRRSLPLGVASVVIVLVLSANTVFLWGRAGSGADGPALLLGAATAVLGCAGALVLLALPVATTRSPDGDRRSWLIESAYLVARRPLRSVILLGIVVAVAATFYLLPTLVPFVGISIPVYLALVTFGHGPVNELP